MQITHYTLVNHNTAVILFLLYSYGMSFNNNFGKTFQLQDFFLYLCEYSITVIENNSAFINLFLLAI